MLINTHTIVIKPMQIFLASSAIKASYERLEETMEAFDVTPTGIPRVQDVSSLKPLGASHPREL